jgi:hypothetical protein
LDILWYPHFAYMVITLALLGFGIAGVITSVFSHRLRWTPRLGMVLTLALAASYGGIFFLLSAYQVNFVIFDSIAALAWRVFVAFTGLLI